MTTITTAGIKGGIGKTTTTNSLAGILANLGYSVIVYDADPQGSSYRWHKLAKKAGEDLPWEVVRVTVTDFDEFAAKDPDAIIHVDDVDFALIDTPPGNSEIINAAVDMSDLSLICMTPGKDDFQQATKLVRLLGDANYVILLTSVDRRTNDWKSFYNYFEGEGFPIFDTIIPFLKKHRDAFGTNPSDPEDYPQLWAEIAENFPTLIPSPSK